MVGHVDDCAMTLPLLGIYRNIYSNAQIIEETLEIQTFCLQPVKL